MISCILGSKDRLSKLKVLFESIMKEYKNAGIEPDVIVIDGGSAQDVIEFLKSQPGTTILKENMMHGVTRAYNRGFRLAKYPYVTWLSDDQRLEPGFFVNAISHIKELGQNDFMGISMNNNDGGGFRTYKTATPVGVCSKSMMKRVDFWSEDYITYSSDIDFCVKAIGLGGKLQMRNDVKIMHFMDVKDETHRENNVPIDDQRYQKAWNTKLGKYSKSDRIYPNIFVSANSADELLRKIQDIWRGKSWCNIYTQSYHGLNNLASMNVMIGDGSNCHSKL